MEIQIEVTPQGGIQMLHDDAVDLYEFGEVQVLRASNVEFNNRGGNGIVGQAWFVESVRTGKILKDGFLTRVQALEWEKQYFSPQGEGWKELTERRF